MSKRWALLLSILLVAGVSILVWRPWQGDAHNAADRELISKLQAENRELRSQVEQLRSQATTSTTTPSLPDSPPAPAVRGRAPRAGGAKPSAVAADETATVQQLRDTLMSAQGTIDELQARATELQTQLDKARQDEKRLAAAEASWKEELASANQQAEGARAELARRNEQLVRAEAANKKFREDTSTGSGKAAQLAQLTKELQELYRRREGFMATILGRYRDITEQYRALANLFDNRRGAEGTPGSATVNPGPEL
ncbi:MAG: hypothetical protein SGI92_28400, partial [Bryobacteraceae bacterium]|nr:hypothetical protein [Bryobacteraceae bacterium]